MWSSHLTCWCVADMHFCMPLGVALQKLQHCSCTGAERLARDRGSRIIPEAVLGGAEGGAARTGPARSACCADRTSPSPARLESIIHAGAPRQLHLWPWYAHFCRLVSQQLLHGLPGASQQRRAAPVMLLGPECKRTVITKVSQVVFGWTCVILSCPTAIEVRRCR